MKKKLGVILASVLSAVLCIGGAGCLNTTQTQAESNPAAYKKTEVFVSPNNSISEMTEAVAFQDTFNPSTSVKNEDGSNPQNGIAIFTESGSGKFEYSIPVQMTSMKATDKIIELYPFVGSDYALMTDMTITLTDAANSKNTVEMYIFKHSNGAIYARCNYAGKSLALSSEGGSAAGRLFDNNYGTYAATYSFAEAKGAKNKIPMAISMDYAERQIYLSCHKGDHLVLDLDEISHVGKNSLWNGFENDEAIISVTMNFAQAKKGGCIVKSILGNNLEGSFATAEDYSLPAITYLCDQDYVKEMPVAGVNVPYAVPGVYAFDWFFGKTPAENIEVNAYKLVAGSYEAYNDDLSDGYLTADEAGSYELRYTVKNEFRTTYQSLFVTVVEELSPIIAVQVEKYAEPVILQSLYIPEVNVFGGSGKLNKTEKLFYNGLEVPLHQTRKITVDKAGVISLRVECSAYTGETLVEYFPIEIPEATVLAIQEVPMILQAGVSTIFPEAVAYDSTTGEKATVEIFVDGVKAPDTRAVTTTKTEGTVEVKYVATTVAHGATERVYNIPVISKSDADIKPSDYMLTQTGNVELTNTNAGLQIFTQQNSQAYWAYPLVTGAASSNATIALSMLKKTYDNGTADNTADDYTAQTENYEYVDIVFTDYQDATKEMFVRIYRICELNEKMSYLQINGVGTLYLIDGALSDASQNIRFYINTATGQLYNGVTFVPVAPLPADYTATLSKVSVRFGGVTGDAGIVLKEIGNQSLNARATAKWRDSIAPMVLFSRALQPNAFISVNSSFIVPAMTAYDLRSAGAEVTVRVIFNDTELVWQGTNPEQEKIILADRVGKYTIQLTAKDANGATEPFVYIYKTVDETAPVLTIEKTVVGEVDNGTEIVIPNASATDNVDTELTVLIHVVKLESRKIYEVKAGDTFQFTITGTYHIRYFVYDSDYNYAEYIMEVKVK